MSNTSTTKNIRSDYLNGGTSLQEFYQYPVQNPDFSQIISDKSTEKIDRKSLQEVVRRQYAGLELGEAVQENIDRLGHENTFTITTGHQLVLMGGPMFTVYKVMTAVKLAEELSQRYPAQQFVPIFWIHTEDHDFEEINHYFSGFGEKQTYAGTFKSKVGNHILEPSIRDVIPAHFSEELKACWQPGRSLAEAFRHFMHLLFAPYGVVMLDADDPALKARFRAVLEQELTQSTAWSAVNQTSEAMTEAGYKLQISPREINLFYLDEEGRNRIVAENGHYAAVNRNLTWSKEEMLALASEQPERFSPNVSLRPLYQEMILPNLCYIGGWGELSYWLQLKGVFARFETNFPLLLPRMSGTIFSEEQYAAWQALGFDTTDIGTKLNELYTQYLPQVWDSKPLLALRGELERNLEDLHQYIETEISETLARSAVALQVKTLEFLNNIEKKAGKVIRNQQPEPFRKIESIKLAVQPDGMVQERVLGLAGFSQYAPERILKAVYEACEPLNLVHSYLILT
ncbi:MAG: bacillithiol biosynthesis cysteine-adding enzyme BshC [Bacteroidota bacterium]